MVSPLFAEALVRANLPELCQQKQIALNRTLLIQTATASFLFCFINPCYDLLSFTDGDRDMKKVLVVLLVSLFSLTATAANKPCSGKKGGISHCSGEKFVCNDGSISKSKKVCQK